MAQETSMTQSTYSNEFNQFTPQVFQNPMFGNLTVLKDSNGRLWFIGVEVATMLGYADPNKIIYRLPSKYKQIININEFMDTVSMNSPGRGNLL